MSNGSPIRRVAALGSLTLLLLAALGGPALAVGADGVSMQVMVPRDADQRMPMMVDGAPAGGEIHVRNRNDEERTVRLFAVHAHQEEPGGSVVLGDSGTAPWVGLPDQELTLAAGESTTLTFQLVPSGVPADTDGRLPTAFVLEAAKGETVVLQAVSLLSVVGAEPSGFPWIWAVIAALMLLAVGGRAIVEWRRQHRFTAESSSVPLVPMPA